MLVFLKFSTFYINNVKIYIGLNFSRLFFEYFSRKHQVIGRLMKRLSTVLYLLQPSPFCVNCVKVSTGLIFSGPFPEPFFFLFSGNVKIIGSLFCGVSFSLVPYFPRDFLPRTGPKLLLSFPHFVRQEGREREGPRGWEGASFPFHRQTTRWPAIMVKIYLKARREIPLSSPAS